MSAVNCYFPHGRLSLVPETTDSTGWTSEPGGEKEPLQDEKEGKKRGRRGERIQIQMGYSIESSQISVLRSSANTPPICFST